MYINRRSFIRIISFLTACILLVGGLALYLNKERNGYKQLAQNGYAADFDELSEHMYNISIAFLKSQYSKSPYQLTKNAAKIWGEAMAAKVNLENLSGYEDKLSSVSKYLSQAGDYMMHAAMKSVKGESLSEEEYENLKSLALRAASLSENVTSVSQRLNNGEISFDEVMLTQTDFDSADHYSYLSGDLVSSADQVSGYPELIYDGPFSDHIEKQESVFLESKKTVSRNEAAENLCKWFDLQESDIEYLYENDSVIPTYVFSFGNHTAAVTLRGGYLLGLTCSEVPSSTGVDEKAALLAAKDFLKKLGYGSMTESYYYTHGNETTINFNYSQDGVIIYPDMIKVCVSMADAEITGFEAMGYLMAHTESRDVKAEISVKEAEKNVSDRLSVKGSRLAVIPTDGKNEVLCYEFETETPENNRIMVYVNAKTGVEEMLQILLEDEKGTLCS